MTDITIRPLKQLGEMYEAVRLQQTYWGDDIESVVPAHMLFTIALYGGQVLAAFDDSRMVGVLIGLLGTDIDAENQRPAMADLMIASKRMVVLPEYRSRGIGYQLKLAQRDYAVKQGIRVVTWTFDPLLSRNAYLNLRKLGAISQKYVENLYGTGDDGGTLSTLGSSDRFSVEWWVWTPRVEQRVAGADPKPRVADQLQRNAVIINPTRMNTRFAHPADTETKSDNALALVEIPADYDAIMGADEGLALAWRDHTRQVFQGMLKRGFIATDFIHEAVDGRERSFYLMAHRSAFDFNVGWIDDNAHQTNHG